jgi:hypothetical protein
MTRLKGFLAALLLCAAPAAAEVRLLMVEQAGCLYCARWTAEVGDAYALTAEGRLAPLQRTQLREELPAGVALSRPATFTPTFVLLNDGAEVGRIEGYPGEDFFWPLLGQLIGQLPADMQKEPGS